jgi:hypothetical protein
MIAGLRIKRYGRTRFRSLYEGDRLLGVIVYKKGAETIANHITELKQEIERPKRTRYTVPAPTTIVTAVERILPDKRTGIYDRVR